MLSVQPSADEIADDLHKLMTPRHGGVLEEALLASCPSLIALATAYRESRGKRTKDGLGSVRVLLADFAEAHGNDRQDPSQGKKWMSPENQIMVVARAIRLHDSEPAPFEERKKYAIRGMNVSPGIFRSDRSADGIGKYRRTFADHLIAYVRDTRTNSDDERPGAHGELDPVVAAEPITAATSDAWGRLHLMSDRLADDIDRAAGADRQGALSLSQGAYVERAVEAAILDRVRRKDVTGPEIVIGEAGDGKTTLLWSLHRKLRHDAHPLLLSAVWFQPDDHGNRLLTSDLVIEAVDGAEGSVVLLDTADLLLHNEFTRDETVALIDQLRLQGIPTVVATRPREADTLPGNLGRTTRLGAYDDTELAIAIPKLVNSYCPGDAAAPTDPVAAVKLARARGLVVDRVCSSPLLLHILFELSAPTFPRLEIDVTGLYRQYWERRVVDDLRARPRAPSRSKSRDLSQATGLIGIAMVAAGRPELPVETVVRRSAEASANTGGRVDQSRMSKAVETLCQRGVLIETAGSVRFLHQTLFEFAAAKGIAERGSEREIPRLVGRLKATPDDLFLGAVVEQLLVLLGDDPLARDAVADAVRTLAAAEHPTLVEIAMLVWAHHPALPGIYAGDMDKAHEQAIDRFIRVIPSVHSSPSAVIAHLSWIWEERKGLRQKVVDACAHLAPRSPSDIADFVAEHDLYGELAEHHRVMLRANSSPTVLMEVVLAADPNYAQKAMITVLKKLASDAEGKATIARYLRMSAAQWTTAGSESFLRQIESTVADIQRDSGDSDAKLVREGLAEVIEKHWLQSTRELPLRTQRTIWKRRIRELCQALEDIPLRRRNGHDGDASEARHISESRKSLQSGDQDPVLGARLIAVARLIDALPAGDPIAAYTLGRLFSLRGPAAGRQLARGSIAHLLIADSPATGLVTDILSAKLAGHLPADHQTFQPGPGLWAAVGRSCLMDSRIPSDRVLRVVAAAERSYADADADGFWTRRDMMLALAPVAIAAGHQGVIQLFTRIAAGQIPLPFTETNIFLDNAVDRASEALEILGPMMIRLARSVDRSATVRVLADNELTRGIVAEGAAFVMEWIEGMLGGADRNQGDGARLLLALVRSGLVEPDFDKLLDWYHRLTHPEAKADVVSAAGAAVLRTATNTRAIAFFQKLIVTTRHPSPTIRAASSKRPLRAVVIDAARDSLLEAFGFAAAPDPLDWDTVFPLAFAPRLSGSKEVDMRGMGNVSLYLTHLADTGHCHEACEYLLEVITTLAPITTRQARRGSNQLRVAIGTIVRMASTEDLKRLLDACDGAPEAFATQVIRAAVRERYGDCQEAIEHLGRIPALAHTVKTVKADRVRTDGVSTFPDMLQPVSARLGGE